LSRHFDLFGSGCVLLVATGQRKVERHKYDSLDGDAAKQVSNCHSDIVM
jgi:hypothetical protein